MVTCVLLGGHVGRKEVMGIAYDLYAFKYYNIYCNASINYKLVFGPAQFAVSFFIIIYLLAVRNLRFFELIC
jgi:hypothetical protein